MENRPKGREKHVTGEGAEIRRRGDGLHTGPVGRADGYQGRGGSAGTGRGAGTRGGSRAGGKSNPLLIIILLAVVLLGGGGAGLSGLLGGDTTVSQPQTGTQSGVLSGGSAILESLLGGSFNGGGSLSTGWAGGANTGRLDTSVAKGARAKYTKLLGGGKDTVTMMVYMCGTDLESKNGMASADLQEMLNATVGSHINLLVYTGGCRQWRNNMVSSSVNQIYRIQNGQIECLVADDSSDPMTRSATLTRFIRYCTKNYPASRNMLIFWDHGGGSISGYGYDEKNASAGSMTLKGIDEALAAAGATYDVIGFDACLMATLENALMLEKYGDYLVASEETEPGVGWYYTDWPTALSADPSMATVQLGKNIADSFVAKCAEKCAGQKTTLSVVDLAELSATVPDKLKSFAAGTSKLIQSSNYETVSNARSGAREFASGNKIDQIDLVHLSYNLNTKESKALATALLGAVKYNRTSSNMTNAYGLSIYFPYQSTKKVDSAVATYEAIGMDDDYARCIQQFASLETGGQAVSGGTSSPLELLLGGGGGSAVPTDAISGVLSALMGGGSGFFGRSLDMDDTADYLAQHRFDAGQLFWSASGGKTRLVLSEEQWAMVQDLQLNVFYDDGAGYLDLGLDNVYAFDGDGALLGEYDGTWLAIDGQPVAYYYVDSVFDGDAYTITGRVPVLLNGDRAELLIVFDNAHPYGVITGARSVYAGGETETVAKSVTELEAGDTIDFICDYYSYDGAYQDTYLIGDTLTYTGSHEISNVAVNKDRTVASYLFTDLYCQEYWTPAIP